MSLPIREIATNAEPEQLSAARVFTARNLHVPESVLTFTASVAYIVRHFEAGQLTGWEGFLIDYGFTSADETESEI
jgi:hypothetical protein